MTPKSYNVGSMTFIDTQKKYKCMKLHGTSLKVTYYSHDIPLEIYIKDHIDGTGDSFFLMSHAFFILVSSCNDPTQH